MHRKRFQQQVAESLYTLPATVLLTAIFWWWPWSEFSLGRFFSFLLCALAAYLVTATYNVHIELRLGKNLVPCVFFVLAMAGFMCDMPRGMFAACIMTVVIHQLLLCCQCEDTVVQSFHIGLCVALGSVVYPPMLFLIVPIWFIQRFCLHGLTFRSVMASLVGMALPYWLWGAWAVYSDTLLPLYIHLDSIVSLPWPVVDDFVAIPMGMLVFWGLLILLSIAIIVQYFLRTFSNSNQVRMVLSVFILLMLCFHLAIVLQPKQITLFLPQLIVCIAPLVGHVFAEKQTRVSNIFFSITLFMLAAVIGINLWTQL